MNNPLHNDHIEHLEDLPVLWGHEGALLAREYLGACCSALYGGLYDSNISTKFDGSFSIVAGYDSRDGKFFVAKKSIFNKVPVYFKTGTEIMNSDMTHDLKTKMLWALEFLPEVISQGIFQGDFLYDFTETKPDSQFRPNTLLYAPRTKAMRDQVDASFIGIAWHTQYAGRIGDLYTTVRYPFPESNRNVLSIDATWRPNELLISHESYRTFMLFFRDIDESIIKLADSLDGISNHPELPKLFKQFQNAVAKGWELGFKYWVNIHFVKELESRKTERGRQAVLARRKSVEDAMDEFNIIDVRTLVKMFEELKRRILVELDKRSDDWSVYYVNKKDNHPHLTGHEGYVITKSNGRYPTKLVHRQEFSRLNFSNEIKHGWER